MLRPLPPCQAGQEEDQFFRLVLYLAPALPLYLYQALALFRLVVYLAPALLLYLDRELSYLYQAGWEFRWLDY